MADKWHNNHHSTIAQQMGNSVWQWTGLGKMHIWCELEWVKTKPENIVLEVGRA